MLMRAEPLPFEAFLFRGRARPFSSPNLIRPLLDGGALQDWTITLDGRPIPFKILRSSLTPKKPLILLHGMGLTIATFHGIAPYLLNTHDLILPDYSSMSVPTAFPTEHFSPRLMLKAVFAIADALDLPTFDLGGNSLGGGMALLAAIEQPRRINRLALYAPACYPQELPRMYKLARIPLLGELMMTISPAARFVGGVEHIGFVDKSRFPLHLKEHYLATLERRAARFRLMQMIRHLPDGPRDYNNAEHVRHLRKIDQPALIVWGNKDPLLVPDSGPRLARDLPRATYATFDDLAHLPHDEAPERIGPLTADFLNNVPKALTAARV